MRTEIEVFDLLLGYAREREDIHAVILNGSRVNPNAPRDPFCDYDVIYLVDTPAVFLNDPAWIARFGDLIVMQQNDWEEEGVMNYIFLMLFADGVRIDLSFSPLSRGARVGEDSLSRVLLDKDGCVAPLPPPSEASYAPQKPDWKEFDHTTNEFWWCITNVAKGLWREELTYAKYMTDVVVRDCLLKMLAWYIAAQHDWNVNPGKAGKWFERYLTPAEWAAVKATYAGAGAPEQWDALLAMARLFRVTGRATARALGYTYPEEDDQRVTLYLEWARGLPPKTEPFEPGAGPLENLYNRSE